MSNRAVLTEGAAPLALARAELTRQFHLARRPLLITAGAALVGLIPVLVLNGLWRIPAKILTRDIFAVTESPVYYGLLSNMGLLVWAAAATTWLLVAGLLARFAPHHQLRRLALGAGLYTLLLLADDALMLHESLLPNLLGLPELLFTAAYAASAVALLMLGARRILSSCYPLCLMAGGLLASSMLVDDLVPSVGPWLLLEDSLKFVGIVFWLAYAVASAAQAIDTIRE